MAKTYKCEFADIEWESITCKKSDESCGNCRYCKEKGRLILTEHAENCPLRSENYDRNAEQQKKSEDSKNNSDRVADKRRKRK